MWNRATVHLSLSLRMQIGRACLYQSVRPACTQVGMLDAQLKRALNDLEGSEGRCLKLRAELDELQKDHVRTCDRAKLLEEQLKQTFQDIRKKDAAIAAQQRELVRCVSVCQMMCLRVRSLVSTVSGQACPRHPDMCIHAKEYGHAMPVTLALACLQQQAICNPSSCLPMLVRSECRGLKAS